MNFLESDDLLPKCVTNLAYLLLANEDYLKFYEEIIVKVTGTTDRISILSIISEIGVVVTKDTLIKKKITHEHNERSKSFCKKCNLITSTVFKEKVFSDEKVKKYLIEYCSECNSVINLPNLFQLESGYWFRILTRLTLDYFTLYPLVDKELDNLIEGLKYKSDNELSDKAKVILLKENRFMLIIALLELVYLPLFLLNQ